MKATLKLEEFILFISSGYVLYSMDLPWWTYLLLFAGPDVGMAGYLAGNRTGALSYNLFHHKGVAVAIGLIGYFISNDILIVTGLILFGHSSMDRMFGYGLKYIKGFRFTHLGEIGQNQER